MKKFLYVGISPHNDGVKQLLFFDQNAYANCCHDQLYHDLYGTPL